MSAWAAILGNAGAVGVSLYLLWHVVTKSLPAMQREFTRTLQVEREAARKESREDRERWIGAISELRAQLYEVHGQLVALLRNGVHHAGE